MRLCLLLSLVLLPVETVLHAEGPCGATVVDALAQRLGLPASTVGVGGFRVRDVLVDHELLRTFVRVERCDHPGQPATLLPFAAVSETHAPQPSVAVSTLAVQQQNSDASREADVTSTSRLPRVNAGSPVSVSMLNAKTSVVVSGRLLSSAAVGSDVDVELASWPGSDRPGLHVRGHLLDNGRVEVQP